MNEPITRIIVWTGGRWVDQETGIYASNLGPPHDAPRIPRIEPTPGAMYGFAITTSEQVQHMIDVEFDRRTFQTPYFYPPLPTGKADGLVRYSDMMRAIKHGVTALLRDLDGAFEGRVNRLENRLLNKLDKPWYKRW